MKYSATQYALQAGLHQKEDSNMTAMILKNEPSVRP